MRYHLLSVTAKYVYLFLCNIYPAYVLQIRLAALVMSSGNELVPV